MRATSPQGCDLRNVASTLRWLWLAAVAVAWRWRWDLNSHKRVSAVGRRLLTDLYFRSSDAMLPKRGDRHEPLLSEPFRDFCDHCVTS